MVHPVLNSGRGLPALGKAAVVAAVAAGALYLAARPDGYAADKGDPPPNAASGLDFVPADAVAVFSIRVADLWNHPAVKAFLEKRGKDLPPLLEFSRQFGVRPDEVERFTFVEPKAWDPRRMWVGVTTVKPCDKNAVVGAAAPDAKEKAVGDHSVYVNPHGPSISFLDARTILFADSDVLESYLKTASPAKEGPLTPVLRLASEKHVVVAGVDVAAVAEAAPKNSPPEWLKPLIKARLATLTVDLDDQIKAGARLTFTMEADAKDGATGLNDALDLFRGEYVKVVKVLTWDDDAPKLAALLKDVQAALRSAKAEQKGATVEVEAALKIDPDATPAALEEAAVKLDPATWQAEFAEAAVKTGKAAKRIQIINNDLKQLVLGSINYADSHGGNMLPAAVYDKNGKALLSWRVLVLPYIEQEALYKEFHLDEPWDSDHNKKLLEKMPEVFAPKDSQAFKDHETFFQAFVGKGTVFEKPGLRYPADIPDGTSQTIMFVEAAKSVPWTKPDDVPFDAGKLLPKVGGLSKDGFMAGLCDGKVRFFPPTTKEETLHVWALCNSGEAKPDPIKDK